MIFVCYVNDVRFHVPARTYMYACDTVTVYVCMGPDYVCLIYLCVSVRLCVYVYAII